MARLSLAHQRGEGHDRPGEIVGRHVSRGSPCMW
jgi:hypothetical protein